jgi:hypothetical protein
MTTVFMSFLGTGRYQPVQYRLGERTSSSESFVQGALVDLLALPELKVCILETAEANQMHGPALRQRLPSATFTRIKPGGSEAELWEIFDAIAGAVEPGDRLIFDCTHGLRSLALTASMAMSWLRTARGVHVERVLYGAFEARTGDVAPVFDLTPMVELPAWSEAVSEWRRTARPAGLVERMGPYLANLRRQLKASSPMALVSLPDALAQLGALLRTMRSDRFADGANRVRRLLADARHQVADHAELRPLRPVLDSLDVELEGLVAEGSDWREPNLAYLRHQLRVARWYLAHDDVVEALSVLRECLTSATVRCARLAGLGDLESRDGTIVAWHKSKYRAAAEHAFERAASGQPPETNADACRRLSDWLAGHSGLGAAYRAAELAVREPRNKLNHCWTGEDHAASEPGRDLLGDQRRVAATAADRVEEFLTLVPGT